MTSYEIQVELRAKTVRFNDLKAAPKLSDKAAKELEGLPHRLFQLRFFLRQAEAAEADGF